MNLEAISKQEIIEKKKRAEQRVRQNHPEIGKGKGQLTSSDFINFQGIDKIPTEGIDFSMWYNLGEEYYWRSLGDLKQLIKRGVQFSEGDLEGLTRTITAQIFKGKEIASHTPLYSDVWELLEDDESPLAKYVTEEDRTRAVNIGFWESLKKSTDGSLDDYYKQVARIMDYKEFFRLFDFVEGVEKAIQMPDNLDLRQIPSNTYMKWYLVQDHEISKRMDKEQALLASGKLVAPLVYDLFMRWSSKEERMTRALGYQFIQGEIVETPAIQNTLRRIFESELDSAIGNYDWSDSNLRVGVNFLKDWEKYAEAIWERKKQEDYIEFALVPTDVREYLPKQAHEQHILETKQALEEMKRFEINLFRRWMDSDLARQVSPSLHGRIRNNALKVYTSQKQRPKKGDVESLSYMVNDDRVKGFIALDLLSKKSWDRANNILMLYRIVSESYEYCGKRATPKQSKTFLEGMSEYYKCHGQVKLDKEGLIPRLCYPKYNKIPDFVNKYPKLFEIIN